MSNKDDEETEPLWLSGEHDHLIQKKLFGSGKIPLEGEYEEFAPKNDIESASAAEPSTYGSVSSKKDNREDNFGGSVKCSPQSSKNRKKEKKKPKSIFDEASEKEAAPDDDSSVTDTQALESRPHMPTPNYCLYFFRFVACVAIVGSLGLIATQIIPLALDPHNQGYLDFALKVYVSLFCVLFLLVELDAPIPFLRDSQLLQLYLSRGFLYSFLGLICVSEAYSERVKEMVKTHADEFHVAWASLFMQISSWLMLGCGLFYMLMGLCCMKKLRDKLSKKNRQAWAKYRKDMKEWRRLNPK